MFGIDIVRINDHKLAVCAAGKAEHANEMGWGGNVVMATVDV